MKKPFSLLTAAALLLAAAPVSALADDLDPQTYMPTIYFKAAGEAPVVTLPTGIPYVNTKAVENSAKIPSQVFLKDEGKFAGQFTFKWLWSDDNVFLDNIQTPADAGVTGAYTLDPANISKFYSADDKMMGIDYSDTTINPLTLSGDTSDAYPVALFDVNVKNTAAPEYYDIKFKTEQPYVSNISYRFEDTKVRDIRPSGEYAPDLKIAVSDRPLADVNDNGIIDGVDASTVLSDYTKRSSNQEGILSKAQLIAADVNGNLIVDGVDASIILSYYAYISSHDNISIIDYMATR